MDKSSPTKFQNPAMSNGCINVNQML